MADDEAGDCAVDEADDGALEEAGGSEAAELAFEETELSSEETELSETEGSEATSGTSELSDSLLLSELLFSSALSTATEHPQSRYKANTKRKIIALFIRFPPCKIM